MATEGADELYTSMDGETLSGLGGDDRITSYHNSTTLNGDDGNDRLFTTLDYGPGYDEDVYAFQNGGAGSDRLRIDISSYSSYIGAVADGGDGDDVVGIVSRLINPSTLFPAMIENSVSAGSGNNVLRASGTIEGGSGSVANEIYGGIGFDVAFLTATASGGADASTLYNYAQTEAGNDVIEMRITGNSATGDSATNEAYGGAGSDTLVAYITDAAEALNSLYGGANNDRIEAYFESSDAPASVLNELYGEGGGDTMIADSHLESSAMLDELTAIHELYGMGGLDQLSSNIEASGGTLDLESYLWGDGGDDILNASMTVDSPDLQEAFLINYLDGGVASDRLIAEMEINVGNLMGDVVAFNALSGGAASDLLEATLDITMTGVADPSAFLFGANTLFGGDGTDTLIGIVRTDVPLGVPLVASSGLYGGAGIDRLVVFGGTANVLDGEAGADILIGGNSMDRLIGGTQNDEMTGNEAEDTFVFGMNSGDDIITDFEVDIDTFELEGGQSISSIGASGPDTLVTFGDGSTVLLQNVAITDQSQLFA